jgi:monofunctional glycosyltransferase
MALVKDALRNSRLLRAAIILLGIIVLGPYLIAPFYRFINPVSTLMAWRWLTGQRVERTYVPLAQIAPALPLTVIMAEDGRFCSHHGIDFAELRGIMREAEDLDDLRGGSTITQQTVKNLFLWPGRSVLRKVLELPLAPWTDLVLPKRRIMEIYLNIAEWGPGGQFGAEAGSRAAFGKSVRQVTPGEAARLAAILPNPHTRSAGQPRSNVQRLAGIYAARAARSSWAGGCVRVRGTR